MSAKREPLIEKTPECRQRILGIKDAVDLLSGKWKIMIIGVLIIGGRMRFMDILRQIGGIAAKMLSKELRELEQNQLVVRTVKNTKPVTVEYELSEHGWTLEPIIQEMTKWGIEHRTLLFRGKTPTEAQD